MEFFVKLIVKLIVVYLLSFPGALIRWGINGFKEGEYEKYFKKGIRQNYLIFVFFVGAVVFIIQLCR